MSETRHKTLSILERHGIDPEKIKWMFKTTKEGRPLEKSFDHENPEYQKLAVFLEDGRFESGEYWYWLFPNKKGIARRKHGW